MIGKTINNYLIESKLGDGGMGEVFYARHNKVDREVAIKVLHSHLFQNETVHNRFKNEANALIKLNHPNIVKIYDYVEQDNFACLIMEYISGYPLDTYISKHTGPLPSAKATTIICAVLDAVQYAHDNNIFHRDIKPSNIMISKDATKVSIMDFGIAKLTDSKNFQTTHANTQLGTPFYMSPEQIKGLPYTRMSDIYSLGVTLFEMVTGQCPYHKITSLFELQLKIVNEPLPLTTIYYPDVSGRIQSAISKATEKLPENRFQNCNEFKEYLLDSEMIIKTKTKSPVKSGKHRNKIIVFAIVTLLAIALGGGAFFYLNQNSGSQVPVNDTIKQIVQPTDTVALPQVQHSQPEVSGEVPSFAKQNIAALNSYIALKEKQSQSKLSPKIRARMGFLLGKEDHALSTAELSARFDQYFVTAPSIKLPSDDQILNDFWSRLPSMPCKIPFENKSQISGIYYDKSSINANNPAEQLLITVHFAITEVGETDKTQCSVKLTYLKSGDSYSCTR